MCACDFWVQLGSAAASAANPQQRHVVPDQHQVAKASADYRPITLCGPIRRRDFWDSSASVFRISESKSQSSSGSMMARPTAWSCRAAYPLCRGIIYGEHGLYSELGRQLRFLTTWTLPEVRIRPRRKLRVQLRPQHAVIPKIDYPPWDIVFLHDHRHEFPLIDHLSRAFQLQLSWTVCSFMQNTPQTWGNSWLYRN